MPSPRPPFADPLDAFCKDSDAYVTGRIGGTLARLKFAAKDIFDVAANLTGTAGSCGASVGYGAAGPGCAQSCTWPPW